ncbi:MAG: hypothetical protein ACT4O0_06705 [Pseudonocardia sp.]
MDSQESPAIDEQAGRDSGEPWLLRSIVWVAVSLAVSGAILFGLRATTADAYGLSRCESFLGGAPTCVFEHQIVGKGVELSEQVAEVEGLPPSLCLPRIDFQYSDIKGRVYRTSDGGDPLSACAAIATRRVTLGPESLLPGKACAILYSSGHELTRQCHWIG